MIVAFSTSSPVCEVALILPDRVESRSALAGQRASATALQFLRELLDEAQVDPTQIELWAADTGPGSFTGTRVGVVLAKTFAWTYSKLCLGVEAFDLIQPAGTVTLPNKKGEVFVRDENGVYLCPEPPEGAIGFGPSISEPVYPSFARNPELVRQQVGVSPFEFLPAYRVEPSISTPKRSYGLGT